MIRFASFRRGVHPESNKNTDDCATVRLDGFKSVHIPMSMHIGPPCTCLVKKGDHVKIGQMIGQPTGPLAVPVHASISGVVKAVRKEVASSGSAVEVVEIESDGLSEIDDNLAVPLVNDKDSFVQAVRDSGLVGLGGAGFPTHMKLQPPAGKEPDTMVINAAECEPYITSDLRLCLEHTEEVVEGIQLVMDYLDIPRVLIGVEDNKPQAINALHKAIKSAGLPKDGARASIVSLKTRYPQGAEKMLIYALTGRKVPTGGLPHDVNVLVLNVGTVRYIAHYLKTGMPLVRKSLTLDGSAIKTPGNFDVPVGAYIPDVIEAAGGLKTDPGKAIMGGSMMGVALDRLEISIIKQNNAILVYDKDEAAVAPESLCIRCARCVNVCPMHLMPTNLDNCSRNQDIAGLKQYHIMDCIECGCCTYVCPAKRYLVQSIRHGKILFRAAQAKEAANS